MQARAPGADFDPRRFRANLLVDSGATEGLIERAWCGGTARAGTAAARIAIPTVRCSMPSRAQRDLPADPQILKTLAAEADRCLGVYAEVERPGRVTVGDPVEFDPPRRSLLGGWKDRQATALKRMLLRRVELRLER
jgi:hypothetical protein